MDWALILKIVIVIFVFALPAVFVWLLLKGNKDN